MGGNEESGDSLSCRGTLADLSNMRRKPNERVDAYIERWQKERCRAHLSEEIQLCRNGIRDDIVYLVSEQITTFRGVSKRGVQVLTYLAQRDERMKR